MNLAVELAEHGLRLAEVVPDASRAKVLQQLRREGVIPEARRARIAAIYRARTELQHAYPDVVAASTFDAAESLLAELGGFFRDYARWMRQLGYG